MIHKEIPSKIVEILDFDGLSNYLDVPKFPHKNFYFEKIKSETDLINTSAKPFKHCFYAISLILEGKGSFNSGFWKSKTKKNILYFKTPFQVVSWDFDPKVLKKYAIVFTENFIEEHSELANIIFDFPFFQLDKTIPLEVSESEVAQLSLIYENINQLYQTKSTEQFNLIATYVKILLLNIRQIYENTLSNDTELISTVNIIQERIIQGFLYNLKEAIATESESGTDFSVNFFASQLAVHPNHLSATLKKHTGKTAQEHIHSALLSFAKTLLLQTSYTIKEIAYRLSFKDPAHFNHFFKKKEKITPLQYRKISNI